MGIIAGAWSFLAHLVTLPFLLLTGISCYLAIFLSWSAMADIRSVKIVQKCLIGLGSGFLFNFVFFLFDYLPGLNILLVLLVFLGLLLPVRSIHLKKAAKLCDSCPLKGQDPHCTEDRTAA